MTKILILIDNDDGNENGNDDIQVLLDSCCVVRQS